MKYAQTAAIVASDFPEDAVSRLREILDFLGIPSQCFNRASDLEESAHYAVIGTLSALSSFVERSPTAHSVFAYVKEDIPGIALAPIEGDKVRVSVSTGWPDLTGPMHGIKTLAAARPSDRFFKLDHADSIRRIIDVESGTVFFSSQRNGLQLFFNCGGGIPDLKEPIKGNWYDIKDDFLSAVPLLLYLKWAFRGTCWQAGEAGACLIIDDPILRMQYGFCNFSDLDKQMQSHSFTTNVAVIPWNWRRTSSDMASLVRKSNGRISISVHGCDHTGAEFGSTSLTTLNSKAAVAKQRMERHKARTGIAHDLIMVFPQGVFSRDSLKVLQQHQYLAAVNTEVQAVDVEQDSLTIEDMWSVVVRKYGSFPFFVRRYPAHGLENFAFDLLLGKPCLIVEHHSFFKGAGQKALQFVQAVNSLNCKLHWRALGDVLRRSYQWRVKANRTVEIRMFANELLVRNDSQERALYHVEKADRGGVAVESVLANGSPIEWKTQDGSVAFDCEIAPESEILIQVVYSSTAESVRTADSFSQTVKIAVRRYLSEFRDNFLSRHEGLLQMAQKTKVFLAGR